MKTIVYRILGNDLPPRHDPNQSIDNLAFFLKHEFEWVGCEKRFCLNRILDPNREETLQGMLRAAGLLFFTISVCRDEYLSLSEDRERLNYLTNVNAARNECIARGLQEATWVFPLDGGTFVQVLGWDAVQNQVCDDTLGVLAIPTWRAESYETVLTEINPTLTENYVFSNGRIVEGPREMSLGFSRKADVRFDSCRCYGEVDKAELLWRLGIKGVWDMWNPEIRDESLKKPSRFFGKVPVVGSVCRLPAGAGGVDGNNRERSIARGEGLQQLLQRADAQLGIS